MSKNRTPNIIISALNHALINGSSSVFRVNRGIRPEIPAEMLLHSFVYSVPFAPEAINMDTDSDFAGLSNFSEHHFCLDEIDCHSMEGFLQSLKFQDPQIQRTVCALTGKEAKFRGKKKKW